MIAIRKNPLSNLSDSQVINRLDALVQKERETTLEVLRHVIEFDRRKLYLGIGYGSLFEYCTRHLGYSESAAFRRIRTARCIRDFPEVFILLTKNELNLTAVSKLAEIITEDNKHELLKEARCKSTRQIDALAAKHNPRSVIRDRVRTVFIATCQQTPAVENESRMSGSQNVPMSIGKSNKNNSSCKNWVKFTSGAGGKNSCTLATAPSQATILKKKFKLDFAVEPECMKKIEEARAILSKKYPNGVPLGKLLEETLDVFLEKKSPERKMQRREKRKANMAKKKAKQKKSPADNNIKAAGTKTPARTKTNVSGANKRSRHIPQAVQDKVFARDRGRCAFVGSNGARCDSTWNLEIDHIQPYARGGDHSIHNLRLLCAKHNTLEAERIYGKKYMNLRINKSRPMRE